MKKNKITWLKKCKKALVWIWNSFPLPQELGYCGKNTILLYPLRIYSPASVYIEENVKITHGLTIINSPTEKVVIKKICRLSCQLYHHYQQSQKNGKHTAVPAWCFPYQRQISRCHHRRRRMDSSRSNHYGRSTHRKRKHYRNKQSCYQRCTPLCRCIRQSGKYKEASFFHCSNHRT